MDRNTKEFWFGVFALVSITVGAGVLTLPYIFIKGVPASIKILSEAGSWEIISPASSRVLLRAT